MEVALNIEESCGCGRERSVEVRKGAVCESAASRLLAQQQHQKTALFYYCNNHVLMNSICEEGGYEVHTV